MPRIAILGSALPVLLAACASAPVAKVAAPAPPAPAGPVKVELYVMSQCPYGIAAENALEPVVGKLGKDVELALEFVGTIDHGGELVSMHGPDEVLADIIQICAAKAAPARILEFTSCLNADPRHIGQGWAGCAGRMQLPVEQIRACVEGAEGKQLVTADPTEIVAPRRTPVGSHAGIRQR